MQGPQYGAVEVGDGAVSHDQNAHEIREFWGTMEEDPEARRRPAGSRIVGAAVMISSVLAVAVGYTSTSSTDAPSAKTSLAADTEGNWRHSGQAATPSAESMDASVKSEPSSVENSVSDAEQENMVECVETCTDELDEESGSGTCSYYLQHWESVYSLDACTSLYCDTCELAGSCDSSCGICTSSCETNKKAAKKHKKEMGVSFTEATTLSCGANTLTSTDEGADFMIVPDDMHGVEILSVEVCAEADFDAAEYALKLYNGCPHEMCKAKHSRWAYSQSSYTGETLMQSGGCSHMTVELDAEAGEGVWLAMSPNGDVSKAREFKISVTCEVSKNLDTVVSEEDADDAQVMGGDGISKGGSSSSADDEVEPQAITEEPQEVDESAVEDIEEADEVEDREVMEGDSDSKVGASTGSSSSTTTTDGVEVMGGDSISKGGSSTTDDTAEPQAIAEDPAATTTDEVEEAEDTDVADADYVEAQCGQSFSDSTAGMANVYGYNGPDNAYLLTMPESGEFVVTVCPHSRSDVGVWLFQDSGDFTLKTDEEALALASAKPADQCSMVEYMGEAGQSYWLVVDGSDKGTFQVTVGCAFTPTPSPTATLDVKVAAKNEYADASALGKDYPWNQDEQVLIIEPHRSTKFSAKLSDLTGRGPTESFSYSWVFDAVSHDAKTQQVTKTFTKVGDYIAELVVTNSAGVEVASTTTILKVRYVRREFRTLSDNDQTKFMDALSTLYTKSTDEGVTLYGDNFKGMDYFTLAYASLAGDSTCNKMSDGLGFLTNHAALTSEFEASLQSMEAHLSAPYWDFTIDSHEATLAATDEISADAAWRTGELFSDDLFGTLSPSNEDHTMETGRFAFTTVPADQWNQTGGVNAYGMLRSPWNLNPSAYVSRSPNMFEVETNSFADCGTVSRLLGLTTWDSFGTATEDMLSSSNAAMIAGAWLATGSLSMAHSTLGTELNDHLSRLSLSMTPLLYRSGAITCPDYCSKDSPATSCQCSCQPGLSSSELLETYESSGALARLAQLDPFKKYTAVDSDGSVSVLDTMTLSYLWEFSCSAEITGDMLETSAPVDPMFWILHPSI